MKLFKLKDTIAVLWFFILAYLQYNKYYNSVMSLLIIGGLIDLIVSKTQIVEYDIDI